MPLPRLGSDTPPVDSRTKTRRGRRSRDLNLTRVIVVLLVGVLLPVLASTAVGIVTLALGETADSIVVGVLVVSFTAAAVGSAITAAILVGRRARIARLQADLLANVTHDLRTPLAAIKMYAQTLSDGRLKGDSQRSQESLDTILRETERLESMIDRVLTWRAASKDRDNLEMKTEPLGPAVEQAARRFTRMVAPGEVDFSLQIDSSAPVLHDRQAINTMVLNLLTNAYKYTKADKKIVVSVLDQDADVAIVVEDNGIGIPARETRRIFDPFYRVDSRLKGKSTGTGLGLAIVQHLIMLHNGEARVESIEGQGSRFLLTMPRAQDPEQSA